MEKMQGHDAESLHVSDHVHPLSQIVDLGEDGLVRGYPVLVVQGADARGQGQEPVGESEHEQGNGRKKQGRSGDGHLHEDIPCRIRVGAGALLYLFFWDGPGSPRGRSGSVPD